MPLEGSDGQTMRISMTGSTYYYNIGEEGKLLVVLSPEQYAALVSEQVESQFTFSTEGDFKDISMTQIGENLYQIMMYSPTGEMKESFEKEMEIDVDEQKDVLSYALVLRGDGTVVKEAMVVSMSLDATEEAGEQAGADMTVVLEREYADINTPDVIGVPEDVQEYVPMLFSDFFGAEYDDGSCAFLVGDLTGDGVQDMAYLEDSSDEMAYRTTVSFYDVMSGDFFESVDVTRDLTQVGGVYLYLPEGDEEQEGVYLLTYTLEHRPRKIVGPFDPVVSDLQVQIYRMIRRADGTGYDRQLLREYSDQVVYENYRLTWYRGKGGTLDTHLRQLNADLERAILLSDSSFGEIVETDGEDFFTVEVRPVWLYNELETGTYPDGFTPCREYVLSLTEAPVYELPSEGEILDTLYADDTYIRIATSEDGWSILQYFGDTQLFVRSDALQAIK
jgi:hypothetical protein